jgi:hypothetical protein
LLMLMQTRHGFLATNLGLRPVAQHRIYESRRRNGYSESVQGDELLLRRGSREWLMPWGTNPHQTALGLTDHRTPLLRAQGLHNIDVDAARALRRKRSTLDSFGKCHSA